MFILSGDNTSPLETAIYDPETGDLELIFDYDKLLDINGVFSDARHIDALTVNDQAYEIIIHDDDGPRDSNGQYIFDRDTVDNEFTVNIGAGLDPTDGSLDFGFSDRVDGSIPLFSFDLIADPDTTPVEPPYEPGDPQDGILAEFFEIPAVGTLDEIDFDATPVFSETVSEIQHAASTGTFWEGGSVDTFAARYSGAIAVEAAGSYTFYLNSDDGSRLLINGVEVIANDGLHADVEKSVTVDLAAGAFDFEILYFERTGRATLELDWEGPGTDGRVPVASPEGVVDTPAVPEEVVETPTEPAEDAFQVFLIDTETDTVLGEITNGEAVAFDFAAHSDVSLYVEADGYDLGSVSLELDDGASRTENVTPYALFGNSGSDHMGSADLGAGEHVLELEGYAGRNLGGDLVLDETFTFTVLNDIA